MLLIKNDPKYNEQWPRPLVPYKRIYGVDEPQTLAAPGQRRQAVEAPARGTPFGLVGTSSLYKRESFPGRGAEGKRHREAATRTRPSRTSGGSGRINWAGQGADAGLYDNSDIHAIRILAMEPATDRRRGEVLQPRQRTPAHPGRDSRCASSAQRRQATARPRRQPRHQLPRQDPGRRGLDLPDAGQGRHGAEHGPDLAPAAARRNPQQLRRLPRPQPEADRSSRTPPPPRPDYQVFDLTKQTPLLTTKSNDESGKKWDAKDETGLRFVQGRHERRIPPRHQADPGPQLCRLPHPEEHGKPAGNLVLDDDTHCRTGYPGGRCPPPITAWRGQGEQYSQKPPRRLAATKLATASTT